MKKQLKTVKTVIISTILLVLIYGLLSAYMIYNDFNDYAPCSGDYCAVIEEHGKIAVAKLEFVKELVLEYGTEQVEISALGYQFIDDDAYIRRLLGEKYPNIDCIIPVKWPDDEVVYIETITDGVEEYLQISKEEFEKNIAGASEEDIKILYDNMNDDQTYVRQVLNTYKK